MGGVGKVRSKSSRLDATRHVNLILQWKFLRWSNRHNACEKCGLIKVAFNMFISTTTLTSSPSDLTAVGQKQEPEFAVHRHTAGIDKTFQKVRLVAQVYVS